MSEFLVRGGEILAKKPGFQLVGRDGELEQLFAILMRNRSNSVLVTGPGGVGISALILGAQASKNSDNTPYDIMTKRFFWLVTDELFSCGNNQEINSKFTKMVSILQRTPDSILVIEDTKDFIDAARNNGSPHFINALMAMVKNGATQIIFECRDEDLGPVLSCHSDMREYITLMDLQEPKTEALKTITGISAGLLQTAHGIKIDKAAEEEVIRLTQRYKTRDASLSRAQPERSTTLLDRALAKYRIMAHRVSGDKQEELRKYYDIQRNAEKELLAAEDMLLAQLELEKSKEVIPQGDATSDFDDLVNNAGYDSDDVKKIKEIIKQQRIVYNKGNKAFKDLTKEIDDKLLLTKELVQQEFSLISGISVTKLNEDSRTKLLNFEKDLNSSVFGQSKQMKQVADGVKVALLDSTEKELLGFMFYGPSGSGKTFTPKVITKLIDEDESNLLILNMAQYSEKHAIAKLIGAPPGYDGFDAGGLLTNFVRKNPKAKIVFDEIEKGSPETFNIFLQIFDDGQLLDNVGRQVNFTETMLFFTTNLDFEDIEKTYRPEFLNRFNGRQNIIGFDPLNMDSLRRIVSREFSILNSRYQPKGITLVITSEVIQSFCETSYNPKTGARGLPGLINKQIRPIVINTFLEKPDFKGELLIDFNKETQEFTTKFAQ